MQRRTQEFRRAETPRRSVAPGNYFMGGARARQTQPAHPREKYQDTRMCDDKTNIITDMQTRPRKLLQSSNNWRHVEKGRNTSPYFLRQDTTARQQYCVMHPSSQGRKRTLVRSLSLSLSLALPLLYVPCVGGRPSRRSRSRSGVVERGSLHGNGRARENKKRVGTRLVCLALPPHRLTFGGGGVERRSGVGRGGRGGGGGGFRSEPGSLHAHAK